MHTERVNIEMNLFQFEFDVNTAKSINISKTQIEMVNVEQLLCIAHKE